MAEQARGKQAPDTRKQDSRRRIRLLSVSGVHDKPGTWSQSGVRSFSRDQSPTEACASQIPAVVAGQGGQQPGSVRTWRYLMSDAATAIPSSAQSRHTRTGGCAGRGSLKSARRLFVTISQALSRRAGVADQPKE